MAPISLSTSIDRCRLFHMWRMKKKKWRQMVDKYRNVKSKWQSGEGSIGEAVIFEKNANRFLKSKCGRRGVLDGFRFDSGKQVLRQTPFILPSSVHLRSITASCFSEDGVRPTTLWLVTLWQIGDTKAVTPQKQLCLKLKPKVTFYEIEVIPFLLSISFDW